MKDGSAMGKSENENLNEYYPHENWGHFSLYIPVHPIYCIVWSCSIRTRNYLLRKMGAAASENENLLMNEYYAPHEHASHRQVRVSHSA